MKRIMPFILIALAMISCKNDDEVTVEACAEVTDIQTTTIGIDQVSLSWNHDDDDATYTVEYGLSGFVPGTGTFKDTNTRSVDLTGLSAGSDYDFYVQSICSTDNTSMQSAAFSFTTMPPLVNAQFTANLSDMNLYVGKLVDLVASPYTIPYELATPLFTDYAHKQRLIALPPGEKMTYIDADLPDFPDNTVISKTFYYYNDENDHSAGKHIIETRILIKLNGAWELGSYHWNAEMTEATLQTDAVTLPVSWVDAEGETNNIDYVIPGAADCFTCHNIDNTESPIGPKLRTLNFNGQLQDMIDSDHFNGLTDASTVAALPEWDDDTYTLEERARAYFDVNCAHCHRDGGYCQDQSTLRLLYETPFSESQILERKNSIMNRMQNVVPGWSMPWIGVVSVHTEGYELIEEYLNSL